MYGISITSLVKYNILLTAYISLYIDLIPFIRNAIPPPMQYPATGVGHIFAKGLILMFYSTDISGSLKGLYLILKSLVTSKPQKRE